MNWCPNCRKMLKNLESEYVGERSHGFDGCGFEKLWIEHFYCSNCKKYWKCKTIDYMGELDSYYLKEEEP